ncbi:hypothetical protein [Sporosarcina sp. GW1-11]|uniref:hypothetical protein n=1 Tax=Sporosarcina sp. GW1-11 TaxID=2899126 RepID=UPI0039878BA8
MIGPKKSPVPVSSDPRTDKEAKFAGKTSPLAFELFALVAVSVAGEPKCAASRSAPVP